MQLVMYVGNDYIASASMDASKLSLPGYVGNLKRKLIESSRELLQGTAHDPEFLVVNFSSPANSYTCQHSN